LLRGRFLKLLTVEGFPAAPDFGGVVDELGAVIAVKLLDGEEGIEFYPA
jgi:hypothetical protein